MRYKRGRGTRDREKGSRSSSGVIALLYLTLMVKFRKAFIKVAFSQVLLFHWTLEGPRDLRQRGIVRNHRGQAIPNYIGLCHSFSHNGPQSSPGLHKILVFDGLCAVKQMDQ